MEEYLNKVIQGDSLEVLKGIPDKSIDLVLTDPPYGTTACKWDTIVPFEIMWEALERVCKDDGMIVMTAAQPFTSSLIMSNIKHFKYCWIWEKPQGVDPFMSKIRPLNNYEDVCVFAKRTARYFPIMEVGEPYKVTRDKKTRVMEVTGQTMKQTETVNDGLRLPKRIIRFKQQKGLHPTQKPVELWKYLMKTYTNPGDTILDPFAGSCTTAVACKELNRNYICIEKEPEYCKICEERLCPLQLA